MKPFKHCPMCSSDFSKFNHGSYFMESCRAACVDSANPCKEHPCPIQYRQQYKDSFEGEICTIQIYTKHFQISYHTGIDTLFPNMTNIYTKHFPRGESTMSPIFRIKDLVIDFTSMESIEKFDQKYFTLSLFL